jgi:predicted NAD-dependent protein-ADP-ribosyltransferase YbiA (DUF1768 family)
MERVLELKFQQHPHLAEMLIRTGNAELVEDSPVRDDCCHLLVLIDGMCV